MKKRLFLTITLFFAPAIILAAQTPVTQIEKFNSAATKIDDMRVATNVRLAAAQSNFTELYTLLGGNPWLAQTTAPNIYNVFWIDTSGTGPVLKYWDGNSWEALTFDSTGEYTLPVATTSVLGGVKDGAGVTITADGTISADDQLVGDCTAGPCLDGTSDGGNYIKLWAGTGSYWTALQGGSPAANRSWRLPIAAPPAAGTTYLMNMDEYGQMGFVDPDTLGGGATVINDLTDVDTTGKATGKILKFDSSGNLVVGDDATGSGSVPSGTVNGQVLIWTTDQWVASTAPWLTTASLGTGVATALGFAPDTAGGFLLYSSYADDPLISWDAATITETADSPSAGTNKIGVKTGVFQPADAQLDTWAGVTPGTGVATAIATATGAVGGLPTIIASGAYTVDTASIAANTCTSSVAVTATGVATTDVVIATPNSILSTITGFGVTTAGAVRVDIYPTSGNVNFQFCNPTGAAIDPGSVTFNWKVLR